MTGRKKRKPPIDISIQKPKYSYIPKRGRKQGTRVLYSLEQTQRYSSQWTRYEEGKAMAAAHIPHKVSEDPKIYRIPSDRSPVGYWQIEKKKGEGGIITLQWQGEKEEGCKPNPPQPGVDGGYNYFNLSDCNPGWGLVVSFSRKKVGEDEFGNSIYAATEFDEVVNAYRETFNNYTSSIEEIVTAGFSGDGTNDPFPYGTLFGNVRLNFQATNGTFYSLKSWGAEIGVPANNLDEILNEIQASPFTAPFNQVPIAVAKVYPPGGVVTDNCNLFDYDTTATPGQPPSCRRGGKSYVTWQCVYELTALEFSFNWIITNDAIATITNDRGQSKTVGYCPPPESCNNIKLTAIVKVERKQEKKLIVGWQGKKCKSNPPPPGNYQSTDTINCSFWSILLGYCWTTDGNEVQPVSLDALIGNWRERFNDYERTVPDILSGHGGGDEHPFSYGTIYGRGRLEFDHNGTSWRCQIMLVSVTQPSSNVQQVFDSAESAIASYFISTPPLNQEMAYLYPPGPEEPDCKLGDFPGSPNNPNSCIKGEPRTWECIYPLNDNEFSLNWIIQTKTSVKNDKNYIKSLMYCTPPEPGLGDIEIISVRAEGSDGDGNWACTCPDFSKKIGAFTPPPYPSMSQDRSWESSAAGCPTWADGKRRCKHIVAVETVEGEEVPVPNDLPPGEA